MAKLKTGRHTTTIKARRQSLRKASHNKGVRKLVKNAAKDFIAAAHKGEAAAADLLRKAASKLDKAAKSGVLHWKTAARKKSRLTKRLNASTKTK
jgi:small subunit ribosomal protein S20